MDLRTAIRLAPLDARLQLVLTRAVPYLSTVQADQLCKILERQPRELSAFLMQVADDPELTTQAKVEYAIHEISLQARTAAEDAHRKEEIADIEQQLDDFS